MHSLLCHFDREVSTALIDLTVIARTPTELEKAQPATWLRKVAFRDLTWKVVEEAYVLQVCTLLTTLYCTWQTLGSFLCCFY